MAVVLQGSIIDGLFIILQLKSSTLQGRIQTFSAFAHYTHWFYTRGHKYKKKKGCELVCIF